MSNEQRLREKVWEILNTIQANQLYVHSSVMEIPINLKEVNSENIALLLENEGFLEKIKNYFVQDNISGEMGVNESDNDEENTEEGDESTDDKDKDSSKSKRTGKKKSRRKKSRRKKSSLKRIELPEILTITILNALVPNSAMLLIGGHGGGKSSLVKHLGRMFTGMSLMDTEDCIIRGHPQLTEEKMIATLNVAKLLGSGEEEVLWRTFTTSFWKILDEVNRLSPYAQNILLSMLAEGKVKYYDYVYPTEKYVLYATLNPGDIGTFEMSPPFLDRFGISVNISMPTTHDLSIILGSQDDKLLGYDEIMQVPAILNKEQLLSIWFQVDKIKVGKSAENFIHSIVREFTLCDRIDKGNTEYLTPESGLCNGCHFDLKNLVCNKVISILSVRVAKDLLRYSKALAWLVGFEEITIDIISAIAPYVISHRAKFLERDLNEAPYYGNKFNYTVHLISLAKARFINREKCYEIINKFQEGKGTDEDIDYLVGFQSSDLIVKMDLIPLANALNNEYYEKTVQLIEKYYEKQNLGKLVNLNDDLMKNLSFPNRGELIHIIEKYLQELTYWAREFTFKRWDVVRHTISGKFAKFSQALEESTKKPCTIPLRDKNIFLEINVTGTLPSSQVQINCHGGKEAIELKDLLEENYPKDTFDFSSEIEQFYGDLQIQFTNSSIGGNNSDVLDTNVKNKRPKKKTTEKSDDELDDLDDLLDDMLDDDS